MNVNWMILPYSLNSNALHGILKTGLTLRISPIVPGTRKQIHNHIHHTQRPEKLHQTKFWHQFSKWDISEHHQWANSWHSRSIELMSLYLQKPKMPMTKPCRQCSRSFQMSAWRWTSRSVSSISTHLDLCFQPKESPQTQRRSKQSTMLAHQPLLVVSEVFWEWQHIVLIPKFSDVSQPLRELMRKDTPFWWTEEHEMSFKRIKQLLTSDTVVAYFDQTKETENWSRMYHLGVYQRS